MPTHQDLHNALASVPGIAVISSAQAEGCGYHYFEFRTDEKTLERLVKSLQEIPYLNCCFSVHYEEGLVYRLSKPPNHLEETIARLRVIYEN
jgi:hypothetical protein